MFRKMLKREEFSALEGGVCDRCGNDRQLEANGTCGYVFLAI
jgi:hypothetical protein